MKSACLAGLCACLGKSAFPSGPGANPGGPSEDAKPASMPQKWIAALLPALAAGDRESAKRVLKSCSRSHFEDLNMRATVDGFRGKMDEFLAFLRREWGWVIDYDRARGVIAIDENKSACVCPLVPKGQAAGLGILCYCSEGFAEMMFSAVAGAPARAEVTESILRGHKSCKYKIELETEVR